MSLSSPASDRQQPALQWMQAVLGAQGEAISRTGAYAVVPSAQRPRLLLPVGSRLDACAVARSSGVGRGRADRAARRLATVGLRAGLLQPFLRERVVSRSNDSLLHYLRAALDAPISAIGLRTGSLRPNAKPIVQIVGDKGKLLGFAKLGWNPLSRRLISAEGWTLARLQGVPFEHVAVPRLLHQGQWQETQVVVQSALDISRRRPRRGILRRGLREIGGALGCTWWTLGASPYIAGLRRRVDAAPPSERARLADAVRTIVERWGEMTLQLGLTHGDFTPWNTAGTGRRLAVWDWERAREHWPLGFDAIHYHAGLSTGGLDHLDASLRRASNRGRGCLEQVGVGAVGFDPLARLYLIELVMRGLEDGPRFDTPQSRRLREVVLRHLEGSGCPRVPGRAAGGLGR